MWLKRRIAAFLSLITILICTLMVAAIFKARSQAQTQAQLQACYLSEALAQDVAGGLNLVACVSEILKERIARHGNSELSQLKRQIQKYARSLTDISIIGADGKMVATTVPGASKAIDFSDRDYFRAHRDDARIDFRIGEPIDPRPSGRVIVPITRRLETENGEFAGVALFTFDPKVFASLYRRVDLGKTGRLAVIGTDGIIGAGYTKSGAERISVVEPFAIREKAIAAAQSSPAGHVEGGGRIYSWRKLDSFPLVAVVGLGKAEATGGAYRQAFFLFGLGALSVGLLITTAAMLAREISRRPRQAVALNHHRHKLREANAELALSRRQAEEASNNKSVFLANIAHELRTPLNAILGFAEIIRDQLFGNDTGRYASYAADIHRAGTHLLRLIAGLLDLAKIEAGKFELHETTVKLEGLILESLKLVSRQAESRGVKLSPQAASDISLYADETALRQIIINLLSNAVKFTPEGGTVCLSATLETSGCLALVIRDTSMGMTAEEIQQAMEPFQQAGNKPHEPGGTGLGVPLAVQLTKLHGGSLTIESTPGLGTTVSVEFPAWRVKVSADHGISPSALPQSNS